MAAVKAAGFEGVQTGEKVAAARQVGLRVAGAGRINTVDEADAQAKKAKDLGYDCYTVHLGWGTEDDDEAHRLVDAVLSGSERHAIPIYIETHRATICDDMWRTVQLTKKFPEIRFNADLSHWYTGHEMVYGDIEAKWRLIQPVFDRVRFIHGRIGNPGSMQVDAGDGTGGAAYPFVDHFREMWTRCFAGFLKSAGPGDCIIFAPELLGSSNYYARLFKNAAGELVEETDRWQQALVLVNIARKAFAQALERTGHGNNAE
jgi:hypothetical protein